FNPTLNQFVDRSLLFNLWLSLAFNGNCPHLPKIKPVCFRGLFAKESHSRVTDAIKEAHHVRDRESVDSRRLVRILEYNIWAILPQDLASAPESHEIPALQVEFNYSDTALSSPCKRVQRSRGNSNLLAKLHGIVVLPYRRDPRPPRMRY